MKLANTYKELPDNWFQWTAYIDGSSAELNNVERVRYFLDRSQPVMRLVASNAAQKFGRTAEGGKEFLLEAEVALKTGEIRYAWLWLNLGLPKNEREKRIYPGFPLQFRFC